MKKPADELNALMQRWRMDIQWRGLSYGMQWVAWASIAIYSVAGRTPLSAARKLARVLEKEAR